MPLINPSHHNVSIWGEGVNNLGQCPQFRCLFFKAFLTHSFPLSTLDCKNCQWDFLNVILAVVLNLYDYAFITLQAAAHCNIIVQRYFLHATVQWWSTVNWVSSQRSVWWLQDVSSTLLTPEQEITSSWHCVASTLNNLNRLKNTDITVLHSFCQFIACLPIIFTYFEWWNN